jgi:hypothetical protein
MQDANTTVYFRKLYVGPVSSAYNRVNVGTIPVRGEKFLERPSTMTRAFGSSAPRFRSHQTDEQFAMLPSRSLRKLQPLRKKAQPFISQDERFKSRPATGPGPGYYEMTKQSSFTVTNAPGLFIKSSISFWPAQTLMSQLRRRIRSNKVGL